MTRAHQRYEYVGCLLAFLVFQFFRVIFSVFESTPTFLGSAWLSTHNSPDLDIGRGIRSDRIFSVSSSQATRISQPHSHESVVKAQSLVT